MRQDVVVEVIRRTEVYCDITGQEVGDPEIVDEWQFDAMNNRSYVISHDGLSLLPEGMRDPAVARAVVEAIRSPPLHQGAEAPSVGDLASGTWVLRGSGLIGHWPDGRRITDLDDARKLVEERVLHGREEAEVVYRFFQDGRMLGRCVTHLALKWDLPVVV